MMVMAQGIILCIVNIFLAVVCVYILAVWHMKCYKALLFQNGAYFHFLTWSPKYSDEQKKLMFLGSRSACLGYFRIYLTEDF